MSFYFIAPIWWLLVSATKSQSELNLNSSFWFSKNASWNNLHLLFTRNNGIFIKWLGNSLIYAFFGAAVSTVLSISAGYIFSKYQFKGKKKFFNFILAGVLVPPAALAVPLFLIFSRIGISDSYFAILLPSFVSPLGVYLGKVAADSAIPDEILEAATIDGAKGLKTFRVIGVRILGPAIVTIFLFQFVAIWNNFILPLLMLTNQNYYPVTLGLYNWGAERIQDPTLITSVLVGSFVSVIPILIGFLLLQRFWNTGLTQGSVKG